MFIYSIETSWCGILPSETIETYIYYDLKWIQYLSAHDIRATETVEIQLDTLANAVLKGGQYSVSRPCRFIVG